MIAIKLDKYVYIMNPGGLAPDGGLLWKDESGYGVETGPIEDSATTAVIYK